MIIARQSTARTVTVGPVLDADGVAVTGGVVADFKISKNGGAPAALNGSATLTHRHTGHYSLALTASDLDTVGQAEIVIDDTVNACPVKEITVLEEAVYDALFAAAATGALPVSSGGIAAAAFAAGAIDADALAADAVTEIRDAVTGGAYALSTDANGRVRIVDGTGAGELDTSSGLVALSAASVSAVADQVWDEVLAGHLTAGSTGNALNAAGSAGDPWSTTLPGAYGAGTAGKIVGDNLNATVSSRASQATADAVEADTQDIQSRLPAALVAGRIDASVGAVAANALTAAALAADAVTEIQTAVTGGAYALSTDANGRVRIVDGTAAGELDTSAGHVTLADSSLTTAKLGAFALAKTTNLTGLNDLSASQVNAEVLDVVNVDTFAEPGQGAPAATATLAAKVNYLYKAWRNKKTQTSTTFSLFGDDAATVDQKSTVSDDGTTSTFGEVASGP